jgi:hypothetical protein
LFYRGRGHHRTHSLPGRHACGTDQLTCPLAYRLGYRLYGHTRQHAADLSVTVGSAED